MAAPADIRDQYPRDADEAEKGTASRGESVVRFDADDRVTARIGRLKRA
jgi:hypothetical protein